MQPLTLKMEWTQEPKIIWVLQKLKRQKKKMDSPKYSRRNKTTLTPMVSRSSGLLISEIGNNKHALFEVTVFIVIGYSSNRK